MLCGLVPLPSLSYQWSTANSVIPSMHSPYISSHASSSLLDYHCLLGVLPKIAPLSRSQHGANPGSKTATTQQQPRMMRRQKKQCLYIKSGLAVCLGLQCALSLSKFAGRRPITILFKELSVNRNGVVPPLNNFIFVSFFKAIQCIWKISSERMPTR